MSQETQASFVTPLHQRTWKVLLLSLLVGLVIGGLTFVLQGLLPDGVIQVANSGAVWSVVAFVIGRRVHSWKIAVVGGALALIGEVFGYYAIAYVSNLVELSTGSLAVIGVWMLIACIAGPLFGAGGYWSVHGTGRLQQLATASLGAIFIGEGLYLMSVLPTIATGLLWFAIAAVITLVLTWNNRARLQIWLLTLALGLVFFACEQLLVLLDTFRSQIFT